MAKKNGIGSLLDWLGALQQQVAQSIEACAGDTSSQVLPLTEEELAERIDAAMSPFQWSLGETGVKIRFSWVCQRGYYPEDLDKANQDTYLIVPSFGGNKSRFLMSVFDGHGSTGELCAQFTRDALEDTLIKLSARYPTDFPTAFKMSFLQINQRLKMSGTDVALSGTTACACFFDGLKVHVANIGDSRAVLGELQADGTLAAVALSEDQTPYRADERQRIREAGGLVMTYSQMMGDAPMHDSWAVQLGQQTDDSGDPPRVWEAGQQVPGCAFTRSIGDSLAERIGVYAEPEILTREVTSKDSVIVLASDGVWEFITSQDVINMAAQFQDPLAAARAIVVESYRRWMQFDVRTDDITAVVAYLDQSSLQGASGTGLLKA